jgi:hypothetical protein
LSGAERDVDGIVLVEKSFLFFSREDDVDEEEEDGCGRAATATWVAVCLVIVHKESARKRYRPLIIGGIPIEAIIRPVRKTCWCSYTAVVYSQSS